MIKLFLNHPDDFQNYLDGYKNKHHAFRIIKSLIPTDTGIEFEIGNPIIKVVTNKSFKRDFDRFIRYANCDECTIRIYHHSLRKCLNALDSFMSFISSPRFCDDRSDRSGIHIHTNLMTPFQFNSVTINSHTKRVMDEAVKIISKRYFNYTGTYNALAFHWNKGNAIIYRKEYNTIEYRCINITWDFRILLRHVIFCHECTRLFQQYLKLELTDKVFINKVVDLVEVFRGI